MLDALLLAGWIGCQAWDLQSTHAALQRPGVVEGNPVLGQSMGRIVAIKVSVNVGAGVWWSRTRHNKSQATRTILPLMMAGAGCTAGMLNSR